MMSPEAARRGLGINATTPLTRESIQSAYRKTVREKHPDLHPGSRINMAQFNDARDVLFREVERRERAEALALAAKIRAKHAALKEGIGHVLKHAIEVGQLLTQVRDRLKHGEFTPFVRKQCQIPLRTAQHYMALAEMWAKVAARDKGATFARLTERGLRAMAGHQRKKDGPATHSRSHAEEQRKATHTSTEESPTTERRPSSRNKRRLLTRLSTRPRGAPPGPTAALTRRLSLSQSASTGSSRARRTATSTPRSRRLASSTFRTAWVSS
jgi:curved DNA-binding protein CbpA